MLISNALKPAEVKETFLCFELGRATMLLPDFSDAESFRQALLQGTGAAPSATDGHHFIYDTVSGALWYDDDGSGAGVAVKMWVG